jgi:hypothetical protein
VSMIKYKHDWNHYHLNRIQPQYLFMNFASVETLEIGIVLKQRQSILTTRPWLTCKNRFPKKLIHDIPMFRVSRSIFKIISLF